MATATAEIIADSIVLEEEGGAVVSFKVTYLVTGLVGTGSAKFTEALSATGLPAALSVPTLSANLVLVKRTPRLIGDNNNTRLKVDLEYVSKGDSPYNFVFTGGTSLKQIQTEKDGAGIPITLSHTWPADDPDFPSETKTQGASVSVEAQEVRMTATGILSRDYPWRESAEWVGFLNSTPWADGGARQWRCQDVSFESFDKSTSPPKYLFHYEFVFDGLGWQPGVVFIDPRTGKPPENLVAGTGTKTVGWYPTKDFNEQFPI